MAFSVLLGFYGAGLATMKRRPKVYFDRFAEKWTCGYCRQQFIDRESAIKHSENCNE